MTDAIRTVAFVVLAVIEGSNGLGLALRPRRALRSVGLSYADGPGLLVQEFGVYSLGIAAAYVIAALDPVRFWGVTIAGIAINLCAGTMHLMRTAGIYVGDAQPMMSRSFERKAGLVHAIALLTLVFTLPREAFVG